MILVFIFLLLFIVYFLKKYSFNWGLVQKSASFFTFLFVFSFQLQAQDTLRTALNGKIPFDFSHDSYEFDIEIKKNKRIRLNAEKMTNYIFNKPGITKIYPISSHKHIEGHDCSIIHLPDSIIILTDHYKMEFIDSTFKINNPIFKNKETKGNYVEIQVLVAETYKDIPIILEHKKLFTAGIGSEIKGELDTNCILLKKGINSLRYHLKGVCSMNSYIQFDFIDNVGKAHSISLNSPIKDI
jgi:hypothetical protein